MTKTLTNEEFKNWPESKWLDLFKFLAYFIGQDQKWSFKEEMILQLEKNLDEGEHPSNEFILMVGLWKDRKNTQSYKAKVYNLLFHAARYLKNNPSVITTEMVKFASSYEHLKSAVSQYKVIQTADGEIVQRDTDMVDGRTSLPSIQAKMLTSGLKVVDLFDMIVGEITHDDVRKMKPVEKIAALQKLSPIFNMVSGMLSKGAIINQFTQINLNASTKEMEAKMLEFVEKK